MAPLSPTVKLRKRDRVRRRVARARRKAAVVTGTALLAAGAGVTVAPTFLAPSDAPNMSTAVEVVGVPSEARTSTLLPPTRTVSALDAAPERSEQIAGGEASYYGAGLAGNPTASGETFDPSDLTAAHRTLPFGTRLRVTNEGTGESVVVRVNDRGPFHGDRVIDVSRAAAERIGMVDAGTVRVEIERLGGARG